MPYGRLRQNPRPLRLRPDVTGVPRGPREQGLQDDNSRNEVGAPHVTMSGYEQFVRGEPTRGKFLRSFETPPNESTRTRAKAQGLWFTYFLSGLASA